MAAAANAVSNQQQQQQQQYNNPEQERQRKLAELNKQEEAFDLMLHEKLTSQVNN